MRSLCKHIQHLHLLTVEPEKRGHPSGAGDEAGEKPHCGHRVPQPQTHRSRTLMWEGVVRAGRKVSVWAKTAGSQPTPAVGKQGRQPAQPRLIPISLPMHRPWQRWRPPPGDRGPEPVLGDAQATRAKAVSRRGHSLLHLLSVVYPPLGGKDCLEGGVSRGLVIERAKSPGALPHAICTPWELRHGLVGTPPWMVVIAVGDTHIVPAADPAASRASRPPRRAATVSSVSTRSREAAGGPLRELLGC